MAEASKQELQVKKQVMEQLLQPGAKEQKGIQATRYWSCLKLPLKKQGEDSAAMVWQNLTGTLQSLGRTHLEVGVAE